MNRLILLACLATPLWAGCQQVDQELEPPKPPNRVPTTGLITLDGKPLAGAVVTFLPTDQEGLLTVADTDDEGRYDLTYYSVPGGTSPGAYRVGVSFMRSASGKIVTLGIRSSLAPTPESITAKELLPNKYSNLGQSILSATVPAKGGTFDFELEGPLLEYPVSSSSSSPSGISVETNSSEESAPKAQAGEPIQPNHVKGDSPAEEPKSKALAEPPPAGKAP